MGAGCGSGRSPRHSTQGDRGMSSPADQNITSVLKESRQFPPSAAFAANALVKSQAEYDALYQRAASDPDGFWAEQAEALTWMRRWDKVLDWQEPHAKW